MSVHACVCVCCLNLPVWQRRLPSEAWCAAVSLACVWSHLLMAGGRCFCSSSCSQSVRRVASTTMRAAMEKIACCCNCYNLPCALRLVPHFATAQCADDLETAAAINLILALLLGKKAVTVSLHQPLAHCSCDARPGLNAWPESKKIRREATRSRGSLERL